jgi:hypothetical protein
MVGSILPSVEGEETEAPGHRCCLNCFSPLKVETWKRENLKGKSKLQGAHGRTGSTLQPEDFLRVTLAPFLPSVSLPSIPIPSGTAIDTALTEACVFSCHRCATNMVIVSRLCPRVEVKTTVVFPPLMLVTSLKMENPSGI